MLQVGDVVRTSYAGGPYLVLKIDGPCTCPQYLRWINGDDSPSEPHYHLTCHSDRTNAGRPGLAWLNGYRLADDAAESVICTEGHSPREHLQDEVSMIAQVELIGRSGCAHSWTQIYVAKNSAPPQSLPDIDRRRVIAYVCLRCGSYRPAIADR